MSDSNLFRWSAAALVVAGLATALFWILTVPFESFASAEVALHPLFTPGQILHVLGALLALFGYIGLYLWQRQEVGKLGFVGFVLAFIGAAFFLSDGMIGLIVFPAVAANAPALVDVTGAMFTGRVLVAYIVFAATNMIGIAVFGIAILRGGLFPRVAALLFILGGILFNLPSGPIPHVVLIIGGVLWSIAAVWFGYVLWSKGYES
jgi:hypothetical protein